MPVYRIDRPRWFDVQKYGATGDGTTDDTSAINAAIAALNTKGKGTLYFPAGSYKTTSALTTITVPCRILGEGGPTSYDGSTFAVATVSTTSATANVFTINSDAVSIEHLAIINNAAGTPSAGAGVVVTSSYGFRMLECTIKGFYDDVDLQIGSIWRFEGCYFIAPVRYGLRLRNTAVGDNGDGKVSDCWFYATTYDADAAIRIESGGGVQINNCYINSLLPQTKFFVRGIDMANATVTSQLRVTGVQIENVTENGINLVSNTPYTWDLIEIIGCGIHLYRSSAINRRAISISTDTLGKINTVIVAACTFRNNSANASTAAMSFTKINNVVFSGIALDATGTAFAAQYVQSGCTNLYDQTGGIAGGVSITGTPSAGQVPVASSATAAAWGTNGTASGASFPGSPATNDRYYRTDYGMTFYYDGTRWLSENLGQLAITQSDVLNGYTASGGTARSPVPVWAGSDIWLVSTQTWFYVVLATALGAAHKWVLSVTKQPGSVTLDTVNIDSGASDTYRRSTLVNIGAALGTTNFELQMTWTKTGTPGALCTQSVVSFRYVAV